MVQEGLGRLLFPFKVSFKGSKVSPGILAGNNLNTISSLKNVNHLLIFFKEVALELSFAEVKIERCSDGGRG